MFTADWNGTEVALKQMHNKNVTGESVEEFAGEIRMMQGMRHPNVVLFLGKAFPIYYPFRLPEYCSVWSTVGKYGPHSVGPLSNPSHKWPERLTLSYYRLRTTS